MSNQPSKNERLLLELLNTPEWEVCYPILKELVYSNAGSWESAFIRGAKHIIELPQKTFEKYDK